jgi:hypothetical protein
MPAWLVKKIPLRPILGWYLKYKGKVTFSFYDKRNSPHDSRETLLPFKRLTKKQNGFLILFSGKLLPSFSRKAEIASPRIPTNQNLKYLCKQKIKSAKT